MTPTYDLVQEYLIFNSGQECPRNFHLGGIFICIAAAVHKRVHLLLTDNIEEGSFVKTYPNLYIGLIGPQGGRKSTGKDHALLLFTEVFPDYPIMSDTQSVEDIIRYMNRDENKFATPDPNGGVKNVRPIVGFINELKMFLSIDIYKSVSFLTDCYSKNRFKSGTIKRGLEDLENPCLNFLACEVPEWITDKMRANIISGGWARRFLPIYEMEEGDPIPVPKRPKGFVEMWGQMKKHLHEISLVHGVFTIDSDALAFYIAWYNQNFHKKYDSPILKGFSRSKHDQVFKIAMILALAKQPIELRITLDNFRIALAFVDSLEPNMRKLYGASGRNEFGPAMQYAFDILDKEGGWMSEKSFRHMMGRDLKPREISEVMNYLEKETGQIYIQEVLFANNVKRIMVMTADKYDRKDKERKEQALKRSGVNGAVPGSQNQGSTGMEQAREG